MSELLPILFSRGQNESIDPRVAPADVHRVAQNVRWRKDGRPAKRYGLAAVASPTSAQGYENQAVNAVGAWDTVPLLAVGSSVRTLFGGNQWLSNPYAAQGNGEMSHWGPGERTIIARSEATQLKNVSSGVSGNVVVHAWDDGTTVWYALSRTDGTAIVPPQQLGTGTYPRVVSTASFVYVLYKNGTALTLTTFSGGTPGASQTFTLSNAANLHDACGMGSNLVIAYQSSSSVITLKLLTAVAVPVTSQTQTVAPPASGAPYLIGVVSDATSAIFLSYLDSSHNLAVSVFNNALTALAGSSTIETDANDRNQPGLALTSAGTAELVWGGYITATETSYMRAVSITGIGTTGGPIATYYGVSPASKPFMGPAFAVSPTLDNSYVWVQTHNSNATFGGNLKWDTQRTYYLVRYSASTFVASGLPLRRQLHTPGVVASDESTVQHLSDVVPLGTGNGYLSPLANTVRFGLAQVPDYGLDAVSFHSIFESARYASRDIAMAGRALQISGGALCEFNGYLEETGFSNFPVIESITGTTGGSLSTASNYSYRAVYEWIDGQGRRHRSAPSDPFPFASGTNTRADLVVKPLVANSRIPTGAVSLHIYRTLANQGTYHRITPNSGPPLGATNSDTVAYSDRAADSFAQSSEFIYTDGGVADNTLPPPCTFMAVCAGRVWLGGQLDRCVVTASKLLVDGEPTQFSDLDSFSVFLPQKCTGLAALDGTVVAFSRERIYLIQGDGPSDDNVGQFNPPIELPSDVGCIDWRSVVATSLGIFFQGKRGIFLLPRGFNAPVFIGAEIEDTLSSYPIVASATSVATQSGFVGEPNELSVRFVCNDAEAATASVTLVYDLRTGGWSVDTPAVGRVYGRSGTWSDTFVTINQGSGTGVFAGIMAENASGFAENNRFISTAIGTGDIRPFGVGGYGQFEKVLVMGEFRDNAVVQVQTSVDGATPDVSSFTVTNADAPDGVVYLDVTPKNFKGSSLRVTVSDAAISNVPTEGFIPQALFIEYDNLGKTKRLPAGRKA